MNRRSGVAAAALILVLLLLAAVGLWLGSSGPRDQTLEARMDAYRATAQPRAYARWSLPPGTIEGRCQVLTEEDRVNVTVEVFLPDGEPARDASVYSGTSGRVSTDARGRATLRIVSGVPVALDVVHSTSPSVEDLMEALESGSSPELGPTRFARAQLTRVFEADDHVRIELAESGGLMEMVREGTESAGDWAEEHTHLIEGALQTPDLSQAAKAQLVSWRDRAESVQAEGREALDMLEENPDLLPEGLGR